MKKENENDVILLEDKERPSVLEESSHTMAVYRKAALPVAALPSFPKDEMCMYGVSIGIDV